MASWLSGWYPIKTLPDYSGGYAVGTVDVEIPASDLPEPSDAPDGAQPTIAFRIFYPCVKPESSEADRPVRWIPQPQRATIAAFAKFLGLKDRMASAVSYLPQQLYWIKLPAHRNATLLEPPTSNRRWPVTIFSHGLAGSRNAYSQICGDLASHGVIVIALDHRDGSSPIQYVRATAKSEAHIVEPVKIPHFPITDEIYQARDKQLRIRLWEISMAYEALMKIDAGHELQNLDSNTSRIHRERVEVLWQFNDMLDIHRPGKVTWAGHSFGAATTVQLLKEIHYHKERAVEDGLPLIKPKSDAAVIGQIMPDSPTLLLDMWGFPLQSPNQKFLWERPLPSYTIGGPNGANVLSVLSEAFQNWEDNLNINKHVIAAPSQSRRPSVAPRLTRDKGKLLPNWAHLRAPSPSSDSGYVSENSRGTSGLRRYASRGSGITTPSQAPSSHRSSPERVSNRTEGPHMFYVQMSQHFSQSDFGVLFPWIAKRVTQAEEPERILSLNMRAMTQVIREAGIEIAGEDDAEVLDKEGGVRRWMPIAVAEALATTKPAINEIKRKLSFTSPRSPTSPRTPRDGMTMGTQISEGMAPLSMPPPMMID